MKLRYFAWVRQKLEMSDEIVDIPPEIKTVHQLLIWQQSRGPRYAKAFANVEVIRVAVDLVQADGQSTFEGAQEISFFPPMTGG